MKYTVGSTIRYIRNGFVSEAEVAEIHDTYIFVRLAYTPKLYRVKKEWIVE